MYLLYDIQSWLTNEKIVSALIGFAGGICGLALTIGTKNPLERAFLTFKLSTEHKWKQREKIKKVLAKYKIHLLGAAEDINIRMGYIAEQHADIWKEAGGDPAKEHYHLHSTAYRILCLLAWIEKFNKEMIFLDTTIASKQDLLFVKLLNIFPRLFCEVTILMGEKYIAGKPLRPEHAKDFFLRVNFKGLPDCIITPDGVESYTYFLQHLPELQGKLASFLAFVNGVDPNEENRSRWDRLHFLHLTSIVFLNNFGYDFQKTSPARTLEVLNTPHRSRYLDNYFKFLNKYQVGNNKEIRRMQKLSGKKYRPVPAAAPDVLTPRPVPAA